MNERQIPYVKQNAERLLDDLATLMRKLGNGEEITQHHLVGLHGDVVELLRELGGLDDVLERYRL